MTADFENDLLLITAAGGKQAQGLLPHLVKRWKRLRLNVSSASSKEKLEKDYPHAEVIQADICDEKACKGLLEGVSACYLVTPAFNPRETRAGYNIIDAALLNLHSGGPFRHLIHSSVIHPTLRKLINHDNKRYIEEYLVESGLPYTIIQPTHLMETVNIASVVKQDQPIIPRFWNPATPFSDVSTRDVGEAAANIFAERERHFFATYQLVGTPKPLSYYEAANIISDEIGKEVRLQHKPIEDGIEAFTSMMTDGRPEEAPFATRQGTARLFMYYNDKGLIGNSNTLEMLIGRKPLDYRAWVRLNLRELQEP